MKEFLSTYLELIQNNHDMVGQVSFWSSFYEIKENSRFIILELIVNVFANIS